MVGASFIGLEAAASLRARELEVHVVAPERRPMERVLGREFGDFIRALHEEHGVVFHLEETATAIDGHKVRLKGGTTLSADLVVVGIGVRPRTAARRARRPRDRPRRGRERIPGDQRTGNLRRRRYRAVARSAQRGEAPRSNTGSLPSARGRPSRATCWDGAQRFADVPFFWSQHYDLPINYVGHAEKWDELEIEGDIKARDCVVRYRRDGKLLAVASIYRDVDSLKEELAMERRVT